METSKNGKSEEEEEEETHTHSLLDQQFKNLQDDWNTYKRHHQFNPLRRIHSLRPFNRSPRHLMTCLQQHQHQHQHHHHQQDSPSNYNSNMEYVFNYWRRTRDKNDVVEEILGERRLAIENGNLKGKRLFGCSLGINSNNNNDNHEIIPAETSSSCSRLSSSCGSSHHDDEDVVCCQCSSSSSSSSSAAFSILLLSRDEKMEGDNEEKKCLVVVEEEEEEEEESEKKRDGILKMKSHGGRWMVAMSLLGLLLMLFTLGIISSINCNGGYVDHDRDYPHQEGFILVPT